MIQWHFIDRTQDLAMDMNWEMAENRAGLGSSWGAKPYMRMLSYFCCQPKLHKFSWEMVESQITLSRIFNQDERIVMLCRCRHLFDAPLHFFSAPFAVTPAVHSQQAGGHHDSNFEAHNQEPCWYGRGLSWPQCTVNTDASTCLQLELWVFLNLAESAPRRWQR